MWSTISGIYIYILNHVGCVPVSKHVYGGVGACGDLTARLLIHLTTWVLELRLAHLEEKHALFFLSDAEFLYVPLAVLEYTL